MRLFSPRNRMKSAGRAEPVKPRRIWCRNFRVRGVHLDRRHNLIHLSHQIQLQASDIKNPVHKLSSLSGDIDFSFSRHHRKDTTYPRHHPPHPL